MMDETQAQQLVNAGMEMYDVHVAAMAEQHGADFDADYYRVHRARFAETLALIPFAPNTFATALELGATDFLQVALSCVFGYGEVIGTRFSTRIEEKRYRHTYTIGEATSTNLTMSLDLESDLLALPDNSVDLVLCCEVLEHMDVDPMFMLAELNRVCRRGATLVLTTPNCCSARNFWKIAHGFRPHFFMQYEKSRSPYRHNIEHDVHSVRRLATCAGFFPKVLMTRDVFEAPVPESLAFLAANGLDTTNRGDGIFLVATKETNVTDRWPAEIYV